MEMVVKAARWLSYGRWANQNHFQSTLKAFLKKKMMMDFDGVLFLPVCCQESCVDLGWWPVNLIYTESVYYEDHTKCIVSACIFIFFWRVIHPVLLESINCNYNNAKWPSVFCFSWSFRYIKHMWLWTTVLLIYLFHTKKEEKMMARLPQEDFT